MNGNVIPLVERFTLVSQPPGIAGAIVYSPWFDVPSYCQSADVLWSCLAADQGVVRAKIESSIDTTTVETVLQRNFSVPFTISQPVLTLGPRVRVSLEAIGGVPARLTLSVYLILRLAE